MTLTDIHKDAFVHPDADVHPSATVGPGAYVGPRCTIGEGAVLHPAARVLQDARVGPGAEIYPGAVVGGAPQDLRFEDDQPAAVEIGAQTVIRENATVSRGTLDPAPTRLGQRCMLMEGAHVGHNAQIAEDVVIANAAKLAGHVRVARGCFISALSLIHQFVDIGELCMLQGYAGVGQHVPPYCLVAAGANAGVVSLNRVGLKRAGRFSENELAQLKACYRLYYRSRSNDGWSQERALDAMRDAATTPAPRNFVAFIETSLVSPAPRARGVIGPRRLSCQP